jgi:signal transduction histidine kinase
VTVTLTAEGARLAVLVKDHGAGISPANQKRIYDRFFTTERERGGTGLGLPIVAAIAKGRSGSVDFTTSDAGTEFRLIL